MKALKKLTGETALYGMPSIIGRFLNWWLNPFWTYVFVNQQDLGKITNIYSYVAFLLVLLTYGMETGFFRFASREKNKSKVFSTSYLSLFSTTLLFLFFIINWRENIAASIDFTGDVSFIVIMAITLAFDIISVIPFAKLRLNQRPIKFAAIKFINIGINIGFNLFFLWLCPKLNLKYPDGFIAKIYNPDFGIGYVFLSNLIASIVAFILLIPFISFKFDFDFGLLKRMIRYSFPILIVGISGMINMNIDKILLPKLLPSESDPMTQLGIYAASFKLAVILNMFIQAFRFAFEPFFFSRSDREEDRNMYALVMRYFTLFGLIIFLVFSSFIDVFKHIIAPQYHGGIKVVPIVLMANLFMGIYFTLSLWYKLSDKTRYGAYMGIGGSIITILINVIFIPKMGYYASAMAILVCFTSMTVVSYLLGKKHYPIPYNLKHFLFYLFISSVLFGVYWFVRTDSNPAYWLAILVNAVFVGIIFIKERKNFIKLFF